MSKEATRTQRGRQAVRPLFLAFGGVCAVGLLAFALPFAPASIPEMAATSMVGRKCVGIFVSGERRNVAADSKSLVVVGTIPCAERGVMSWSMQGVYRAFEDGTVEFLASPTPPCPEGDAYVWIRFPNPAP